MQYPNSGALFPNSWKKNEKQPDHKGTITLERSLLKKLLDLTTEDEIPIKLSGWDRRGNKGMFISLKYDDFKEIPKVETPKIEDGDIPF